MRVSSQFSILSTNDRICILVEIQVSRHWLDPISTGGYIGCNVTYCPPCVLQNVVVPFFPTQVHSSKATHSFTYLTSVSVTWRAKLNFCWDRPSVISVQDGELTEDFSYIQFFLNKKIAALGFGLSTLFFLWVLDGATVVREIPNLWTFTCRHTYVHSRHTQLTFLKLNIHALISCSWNVLNFVSHPLPRSRT